MENTRQTGEFGRRSFIQGVAAGAVGLGLSGAVARVLRADEGGQAAVGKVKQRTFGRTGREISCIGVGGGGLNPANANLLQAAWNHGINFIDVAWSYGRGQAELGTGTFLQGFPDREKLFVSTKASGFSPAGTAKEVYESFKARVQEQLARLKTDYVDLMMWPHGATDTSFLSNEAMQDAFRKLREEGLVKHFGVSSHKNYAAVGEAVAEHGFYDAMLIVLNICSQNAERAGQPEEPPEGRRGRGRGRQTEDTTTFLKKAREKNLGVMAMKVANPGFMTGRTDELLAEAFPGDSAPDGWSRHQKLYRYGLDQEGVSTVVVGMRSVLHLKEAIAVGAA